MTVENETFTGEKVEWGAIPHIRKGWMGLRTRKLGLHQTTISPKNKGRGTDIFSGPQSDLLDSLVGLQVKDSRVYDTWFVIP